MKALGKGNIKLALQSLGSSKARSFLTMLGIIIGVAAVIVVVCIGEGVKVQVAEQSSRYGKDVLVIRPGGGRQSSLAGSSVFTTASGSLSSADIAVVSKVGGIEKVVPIAGMTGVIKADRTVEDPLIVATSSDFAEVIKHPIDQGVFLEQSSDAKMAVLGDGISHELFEDSMPLGQTFTLRGEKFMVAGVFEQFAASPFSLEADFNEAVFISYDVAKSLLGTDPTTYQILAKTVDKADAAKLAKDVESQLVASHGGTKDILVSSAARTTTSSEQTLSLLTMTTAGVALIAFLVGGIGIMNVMLVSVTERTQEVGLRKAIGATNVQIMRQFVAEALTLSAIGAIIGVVLAIINIGLLRLYTSLEPVFVWQIIVLAPLVAVMTGVVFGTFPAVKAARKDPIEALRRQ